MKSRGMLKIIYSDVFQQIVNDSNVVMCVCDIIQAYAYNSLGVFDPSVRLITGTKQLAPGNGVNLKYRFRLHGTIYLAAPFMQHIDLQLNQERNMRDA